MRGFLLIFVAGLGSAALGCALGWLIGLLSPEFIALIASPNPVVEPQSLGAALGLVSGLLLGVLAMGFGLLVEVLRVWILSSKTVQDFPPIPPLKQSGPIGGGISSMAVQRPS